MSKHDFYATKQRPAVLAVRESGIPQALRLRPQWIAWDLCPVRGEWSKIPLDATSGRCAKSNDPTTWTTFEQALGYHLRAKTSGIGFVFHPQDPFIGIDIDSVRDPHTGELDEKADNLIEMSGSYAEVSPSGTGVKVFGIGKLPKGYRHKVGKVEVYDQLRYFAVTGRSITNHREPRPCKALLALLMKRLKPSVVVPKCPRREGLARPALDQARAYIRRCPGAVSGRGGHNFTYHVAMLLVEGFALTDAEAWACLCEWNERCEPPWTDRELRHKIDSARKRLIEARVGERLR
jgi:hypothetical protein